MEVYLFRHAQSEGNLKGFFQGNIDSPLTDTGRSQAAHLAKWLEARVDRPDFIYASPLQRTMDTARAIAAKFGMEVTPEANLREYGGGKLEGLMPDEVDQQYPAYKDRPLDARGDFSAYGGESYEEMHERLQAFLGMVRERHEEGQRLFVVSHGGTLYQLLKLWCGWPTPRHYFTAVHNCTCFKLKPREVAGHKAAELQWMVPLELMGWQADGKNSLLAG